MWTFCGEALQALVEGIMDAEVSAQIGAEHGERNPETRHPPQRLPQPRLGHPGGDDGVTHSQDQRGQLLFPACWSPDGAARRRYSVWCGRPTWKGCPPGEWMI